MATAEINAMRFDGRGRATSSAVISVNRIEDDRRVYLFVGPRTNFTIPLEKWLELVRATVRPGDLRPGELDAGDG